jgi:hypothetical protein
VFELSVAVGPLVTTGETVAVKPTSGVVGGFVVKPLTPVTLIGSGDGLEPTPSVDAPGANTAALPLVTVKVGVAEPGQVTRVGML